MERTVTLVDETGHKTGTSEIVAAHTGEGKLHRAFSVYVFRDKLREILIQKRSEEKMLWGGIWANTCCSHPFDGESPVDAGSRRLREELGFACPLTEHSTFVYRALDPKGKGVEWEHVTILTGDCGDAAVHADPKEVAEWKWIDVRKLREDMDTHPDLYAPWFHLGLTQILKKAL